MNEMFLVEWRDKLPKWAEVVERDHGVRGDFMWVKIDPDVAYPLLLERMGIKKVTRAALHCAQKLIIFYLRSIIGSNFQLWIPKGEDNQWQESKYPAGKPLNQLAMRKKVFEIKETVSL